MGDAADDAERRAERELEEEGMGHTEIEDAHVDVVEGDATEVDEAGVEVMAPPEEIAEARNLPAVRAHDAVITRSEISVEDVVEQRNKIKQVMAAAMTADVHYGVIPGTKGKPTLLKPGAETICVTLRLAPHYKSERIFHQGELAGHLTVISEVTLQHIPTGLVIATGEGLCSSQEEKYAYRGGARLCPVCGTANIKRSKYAPRAGDYEGASSNDPPGWYCFAKTGGCGANFPHDADVIVSQSEEKQPNPNLADTWNTVMKMANKRALIAAVLNGTAASDIFTQDAEDFAPAGGNAATAAPAGASQAPRSSGSSQPAAAGAADSGAQNAPKPKAGGRKPSERAVGKMNALRSKLMKAGLFTEDQWHRGLKRDFGLESSTEMNAQQVSTMIQRLELAEANLTDEQKARLES